METAALFDAGKKGRGLRATRELKTGEVVFAEPTFSAVVFDRFESTAWLSIQTLQMTGELLFSLWACFCWHAEGLLVDCRLRHSSVGCDLISKFPNSHDASSESTVRVSCELEHDIFLESMFNSGEAQPQVFNSFVIRNISLLHAVLRLGMIKIKRIIGLLWYYSWKKVTVFYGSERQFVSGMLWIWSSLFSFDCVDRKQTSYRLSKTAEWFIMQKNILTQEANAKSRELRRWSSLPVSGLKLTAVITLCFQTIAVFVAMCHTKL